MKTKTFKDAIWGTEKELTRDQYIQEWVDASLQFAPLFPDMQTFKYFDMVDVIRDQAGAKWDKQ